MNNKTEMPKLGFVIGPNRYVCSVLDDMRDCVKTLNFSYLESLIDETQMMVNRMESALGDQKDYDLLNQNIHKLKEAQKALEKEVKDLIAKRDKMEKEDGSKSEFKTGPKSRK